MTIKQNSIYYFVKCENSTETILKTFSTKEECQEFCQKRDIQLEKIHKKQQKLYNTTKKYVFFNVFAGNKDFFQADEKVINWYSMHSKKSRWGVNFSIKRFCDLKDNTKQAVDN